MTELITTYMDFILGIAYGIPLGIIIGLFVMIRLYKRAGIVSYEE